MSRKDFYGFGRVYLLEVHLIVMHVLQTTSQRICVQSLIQTFVQRLRCLSPTKRIHHARVIELSDIIDYRLAMPALH